MTSSAGLEAGNVRLWDTATGRELRVLQHPGVVVSVAFSPDGNYVLTGSRDNLARLWDTGAGQMVREFAGHTNIVWDVAFSPDGRYALTASQDQTARLWEVATGRQVRLFPGHANAPVASASISPDGRMVAVGSFDGVAQLAHSDVATLVQAVCGRVLRDFTTDERTAYGLADSVPTCRKP